MALRLPRFIRLPEHNRFEYKPMYYDKRKEELNEKINKFKQKKESIEKGEYKPEIKGKFTGSFSKGVSKKHKKEANIRLLIIIVFTAIIAYIVIQNADVINKMFEVLISE